ncbi:MAG: glpgli family protein [Bacteroidales bacterium]|nr:glpgli family protein [Bacteroidales bacterium]
MLRKPETKINGSRSHLVLLSLLVLNATCLFAQTKPVKVPKDANLFYYQTMDYGEQIDTQYTVVETDNAGRYLIIDLDRHLSTYTPGYIPDKDYIQGYSVEDIIVSELADSVYTLTSILYNEAQNGAEQSGKESYLTVAPFSRSDIQFETDKVGGLTRYTCSINSNKLEFYLQPYSRDITPLPHYGRFKKGLLVSYWRNGQCQLCLTKAEKTRGSKFDIPEAQRVTGRELNNIKRDRMVITTRIFDNVQLCWGKQNSHIKGDPYLNLPEDTVLHFAGGTLALKRINLPRLPSHYQTFVEIHQRSNGDAYDRTGSLFVVPLDGRDESFISFFRGINEHPDSLPTITDREGRRYQGIRIEGDTTPYRNTYYPPLELVRFFTSFGVGHFNDRVKLDGLTWEDENYYKQEVTELTRWLQDDVLIGIWIGNYDGGGHIVTVDLKSYPGDFSGSQDGHAPFAKPLFNTCNVLEMAGQNYGRLFGTDSLSATFYLPANVKNTRLRYITTGHGGWDGGDEFNPKPNTIIIDGKPLYTYTPWRCDCGRYRQYNPVSGNFWNGLSSSDYSRSGWCPGTATQPTYFDLSTLTPGIHTITVAIPQGPSQEGSFSHWNVSGALLFEP